MIVMKFFLLEVIINVKQIVCILALFTKFLGLNQNNQRENEMNIEVKPGTSTRPQDQDHKRARPYQSNM
jgi:hypothetical protein